MRVTKNKFQQFNEKTAEIGSIAFFWFILISICITCSHSCESKPKYNPRIDEVYRDTIYLNDSAYVVHKQIDSVYKGEDPNPPVRDDDN